MLTNSSVHEAESKESSGHQRNCITLRSRRFRVQGGDQWVEGRGERVLYRPGHGCPECQGAGAKWAVGIRLVFFFVINESFQNLPFLFIIIYKSIKNKLTEVCCRFSLHHNRNRSSAKQWSTMRPSKVSSGPSRPARETSATLSPLSHSSGNSTSSKWKFVLSITFSTY